MEGKELKDLSDKEREKVREILSKGELVEESTMEDDAIIADKIRKGEIMSVTLIEKFKLLTERKLRKTEREVVFEFGRNISVERISDDKIEIRPVPRCPVRTARKADHTARRSLLSDALKKAYQRPLQLRLIADRLRRHADALLEFQMDLFLLTHRLLEHQDILQALVDREQLFPEHSVIRRRHLHEVIHHRISDRRPFHSTAAARLNACAICSTRPRIAA